MQCTMHGKKYMHVYLKNTVVLLQRQKVRKDAYPILFIEYITIRMISGYTELTRQIVTLYS